MEASLYRYGTDKFCRESWVTSFIIILSDFEPIGAAGKSRLLDELDSSVFVAGRVQVCPILQKKNQNIF